MIIRKGYRFKLDATPQQEACFWQYCGTTRWIFNRMLTERSSAYEMHLKIPTKFDQIKQLAVLKRQEETKWLKTIHSQVLQMAVADVDTAFARFFDRIAKRKRGDQIAPGYPQFKRKHGRRQSFSYQQGVRAVGDKVWLPKIGWARFRKSREIEGVIKSATISHKASGWHISFNCEVEIADPVPCPITESNSVGVDLGSIDLVTLSNGDKVSNPRHFRRIQTRLKRAQRIKSRRKPGSNRYAKARHHVAVIYEHITNCRVDTLHKLSRQLIDENQAIFCETLNAQGIARTLGKSVYDAAWGQLVYQLEYKAAWAGKTVIKVNRFFPSSKLCSNCGYKHIDLDRSDRSWLCPSCGTLLDRDVNAAINIKQEGLRLLAAGYAESENAHGQPVRPAIRAGLVEVRIPSN